MSDWEGIHERIETALASAGSRKRIALEMDITEGTLSKLLSGELKRLSQLLALLDLSVHESGYVRKLRDVLGEELRPRR